MSTESATAYAESIAAEIEENVSNGYPFGIASEDNPVTDREDGEELSGFDWLDGVLDIQFVVTSDRQYRAARVCIALGGPTAWVNTLTGNLEVNWWSATVNRELPREFIDALDSTLEEYWEMGA